MLCTSSPVLCVTTSGVKLGCVFMYTNIPALFPSASSADHRTPVNHNALHPHHQFLQLFSIHQFQQQVITSILPQFSVHIYLIEITKNNIIPFMKSLPAVSVGFQLLQKAETELMKITLELEQKISDLLTKVSEWIQRDKFVTELIDDNHSQINSKQYESLEVSIQNLKNWKCYWQ